MTRRDLCYYAAVGVVFCLSLAIEAARINGGIWRDEATSYFTAAQPTLRTVLARVADTEVNPPLFFVLLHAWLGAFGRSVGALKLLPQLFGAGSLVLTYAIARRNWDRTCAIVALAFAGANFLIASYASELRMYALAGFLCSLAVFFTLEIRDRKRVAPLAAVCSSMILLFYTTYVAVFVTIALALTIALRPLRLATKVRFFIFCVAVPCAFAMPLIALEHAQAASNIVPLGAPLRERLQSYLSYTEAALPLAPAFRHHEIFVAAPLGLLFVAVALFAHRIPGLRDDRRRIDALRTTATIFASVTFAEAMIGLNLSRYVMPVAYVGCMALAMLVCVARDALARATHVRGLGTTLVAATIAVVLMWASSAARAVFAEPKSGLSSIARAYPLRAQPDLAFVVAPDFAAQTLAYYEATDDRIAGFVHWARPDFFDIRGYANAWTPRAVDQTLRRIDELKRRGVRRLGLVRIDTPPLTRSTAVYYDLGDRLYERLTSRYKILARTHYAATAEPATLYILQL